MKECEMSSCTPCHDGLLHQNHKIQTTWLYNTHGCAFQNPIFMAFYMLFRMLETTYHSTSLKETLVKRP